MKLQKIDLSTIKFTDDTFSLTPSPAERAPLKLVQSISRVGILHPPIIVEIADNIYRIGSGRLRLLAALELNIKSCTCYIFKATTHPLDVFNYIYEETSHTNLPLISKAIFLKKTGKWLSDQELVTKFMEGFQLQPNHFYVSRLQQLAGLEINIQEALLAHLIDEKICHELIKFEFIDRMGLFDTITNLSLSVGNQRKLLIASREIAIRSQITIADFLNQPCLTTILTNQSLNTPQKTTTFMTQLQKLRFPLLTKAEQEFKSFIKTLSLPKQISISHSPSFEKDEFLFTITCKSKKEVTELMTRLNQKKIPAENYFQKI